VIEFPARGRRRFGLTIDPRDFADPVAGERAMSSDGVTASFR